MLTVPELNLGTIDAVNYKGKAEKEFLARVFFRDYFLETIIESKKYFLIGEKGTGKTAYAVLLNNSDYDNTLSTVKNLTETDYVKFIRLRNGGIINVSEYSDAWKVILLLLASHHLMEKEPGNILEFGRFKSLQAAIDEYYNKAFSPEIVSALEFVEFSQKAAAILTKHMNIGATKGDGVKVIEQPFRSIFISFKGHLKMV